MSLPTEAPDPTAGRVRLTVPARSGSLAVVRTVVATLGARADLTIDDLDDLAIAAEEAMLTLMSAGAGAVELAAVIEPGEIALSVSSDGDPAGWPPAGLESGLAWRVLTGLAGGVRLTPAGTRPGIEFHKRSTA